jgi:hypothetical protein
MCSFPSAPLHYELEMCVPGLFLHVFFPIFQWADLHYKFCVALVDLRRSINKMCIEYRPFSRFSYEYKKCLCVDFVSTTTYVCMSPLQLCGWLLSLKWSIDLMEVIQSLIITLPSFMSVLRSTPDHKLLKDECIFFLKGDWMRPACLLIVRGSIRLSVLLLPFTTSYCNDTIKCSYYVSW